MAKYPFLLTLLALLTPPSSSATLTTATADRLKIFVTQDHMVRVTGDEMSKAGFDLSKVDPKRANLYCEAKPVPIVVDGLAKDGTFVPQSAIVFWGQYPRGKDTPKDLFATENVYTLVTDGSEPPSRYRSAGQALKAPAGETFIETQRRTLHMERDSMLVYRQKYTGLATDRTMWRSFKAPPRGENPIVLDSIPDLARGTSPSRLRMQFWGSSYLPETPDHDWNVSLNGTSVGRAQWDGTTHLVFATDSLGAAYRAGGRNVVSVKTNLQGDKIDSILLDWLEVDYTAALVPTRDYVEIDLPGGSNGVRSLRIAPGFSTQTVRAFDLDGAAELPIDPVKASASKTFGAVIRVQASGDSMRVVAVGPSGFAKPARMAVAKPSHLRDTPTAPEYLVVTHKMFMDGARELVERRKSQGLSTQLVDIDDVYDEYSNGRFSPEALKHFIDDVLTKPGANGKKLRYVLLLGDATSDYKHTLPNSETFVPTLFETEEGDVPDYWPMYARDDSYVYGTDAKKIPKAAIGRLPCRTKDELRNFLDKLAQYEDTKAPEDSAWTRRGIFISAEGFAEMCKWVAVDEPFRAWTIDTIYARPNDVAGNTKLQDRILSSLDQGAGTVYFVGHGAYLRWRTGPYDPRQQTDLFTKEHLAKLTNIGRYPIVFTSTCYSAMFDNPAALIGSDSGIGVYMVEAKDKGAIACVGHVGKTGAGTAQTFSQKVMQEVYLGHATRLGDAFFTAKQTFHSDDFAGIALIGDPALYLGSRYAQKGQAATPPRAGQ